MKQTKSKYFLEESRFNLDFKASSNIKFLEKMSSQFKILKTSRINKILMTISSTIDRSRNDLNLSDINY